MKRLLTISLALLMSVSLLASCSSRDEASSEEVQESREESSSAPGERPSVEEAALNNEKMPEDDVHLIQLENPKSGDTIAVLDTSLGEIRIVLYPEQAPKAVENFSTLAQDSFYNGKVFHYVDAGFMIQSGAVNSNGTGSRSVFTNAGGEQEFFETEPSWDLWHFRGAVSLANTNENLNGSQFIIVKANDIYGHTAEEMEAAKFPRKVIDQYKEAGGAPHRDGYSTVFGMVYQGMDVVDAIAEVEVDASGMPVETVLINSITIEVLQEDVELEGASGEASDSSREESSAAA